MTIRTKLHFIAENFEVKSRRQGRDHPIIKKMINAASYIADNDVVELLRRPDAAKSITAIIEAGLARLPFSPMVVEFEAVKDSRFHEMVYLEETGEEGVLQAGYAMYDKRDSMCLVADFIAKLTLEGEGFLLENVPPDATRRDVIVAAIMCGVQLAMLMLNTKGIEKEEIHVGKINKQRKARGKPAIPHHTVVRIGTVYRRDGSGIKYSGGWKMPIHWRVGYTRTQHYGKGNTESKIIFIPPCLVNFKPDEEAPLPKKHIKV